MIRSPAPEEKLKKCPSIFLSTASSVRFTLFTMRKGLRRLTDRCVQGRGPRAQFVTHEYVNTRHAHTHAYTSFSQTLVIDARPKIFIFVSTPPCLAPNGYSNHFFHSNAFGNINISPVLSSQLSQTLCELHDRIFD